MNDRHEMSGSGPEDEVRPAALPPAGASAGTGLTRRGGAEMNGAALAGTAGTGLVGPGAAGTGLAANIGPNGLPSGMGLGPMGRWPGEESGEEINLQQFFTVLLRRWKLVLSTLFVVVALAAFYAFTTTPIYQATATLEIDASSATSKMATDMPILSEMMPTGGKSIPTEVEIIKGATVQNAAKERLAQNKPKVAKALDNFSGTDVQIVGKTNLITVSAVSHNPGAARDYANAICRTYIDQDVETKRAQTHKATEYVANQLNRVRQRLDQAQTALKAFKERFGTFSLTEEAQMMINASSQSETDLKQAVTETTSARAQLERLRRVVAGMPAAKFEATGKVRRFVVDNMKREIAKLQLERTQKRTEYTEESPEIKQIDEQIAKVQEQLKKEAEFEIPSYERVVNPVRQAIDQDIAELQGKIWAGEARTRALQQAVTSSKAKLTQLPEKEYRLNRLNTDAAALLQTYQTLNDKYQTLLVSEAGIISDARVVQAAELPLAPIKPRKLRILVLAVLLGALLAVALASLVDRIDDRLHSEKDAEAATRLPVLAQIPYIVQSDRRRLLGRQPKNLVLLETFRMLRTNIAFARVDEPVRSVVVTSSLPNEGKSDTALNLAVAAAQSGEQVILVDCDLRRPSLHTICKLPNNIGLSNIIMHEATLEGALQESGTPGLRILTSGPVPPNPFNLLNSKTGRATIQKIIEESTFAVFDSPPSLILADTQVVATEVDGVLLVVSSKDTKKRAVLRTRDLLAQTGTELLGVILNKVSTGLGGSYQSYGDYGGYLEGPHGGPNGNGQASLDGQSHGAAGRELTAAGEGKKHKDKD
jgi:polysaccharide biosynthesis transport protein